MADLAACYFCGTSDAVEPHPVIPGATLEGPETVAVALCPACADKWRRAAEHVIAAVRAEDGARDPIDGPGDRRTGDWPSHDADPDRPAEQDSGESNAGSDVRGPPPTDEAAGDSSRAWPSREAGREDTASDDHHAAGQSATEGTSPTDPDGPTDGDDADPPAGQGIDPSPTGAGDPDRERADGSVAPDPDPDPDPGPDPDSERDPDPFDPEHTVTPTRRAANRVLRLLQNRDFPMEQREFVDVAASAYDLEPAEVRGVIDLAIDRGHLEREGTELRRPPPAPTDGDDADANDGESGDPAGGVEGSGDDKDT